MRNWPRPTYTWYIHAAIGSKTRTDSSPQPWAGPRVYLPDTSHVLTYLGRCLYPHVYVRYEIKDYKVYSCGFERLRGRTASLVAAQVSPLVLTYEFCTYSALHACSAVGWRLRCDVKAFGPLINHRQSLSRLLWCGFLVVRQCYGGDLPSCPRDCARTQRNEKPSSRTMYCTNLGPVAVSSSEYNSCHKLRNERSGDLSRETKFDLPWVFVVCNVSVTDWAVSSCIEWRC